MKTRTQSKPLRPPRRPVLQVEQLQLRRGDTVILDDISWRVERGQHWVILGANGCGKTSLLKAGRVLAAGKKSTTLTARNLSRAFNARISLVQSGGRYALTVAPRQVRMM